MRQIILDTETTGLKVEEGHRIVEIGCLEMVDRRLTGNKFFSRLNPGRKIDKEASKITGITDEMVKDAPLFGEIVAGFIEFLQDSDLIIHNANFDIGFLNNELKLVQHKITDLRGTNKTTDTLLLAREMFPNQRNSLDALCKRFSVDNSKRTLHGSLLDAELLAEVYLHLTKGQTSFFSPDYSANKLDESMLFQPVERNGKIAVIYAGD